MAYDFDIVYKKKNDNQVAGALSRMPSHELSCLAISSVSANLNQQILDSYENDPEIQKLIQEL